MWVAGNKFRALLYILEKGDTLCRACGRGGTLIFGARRVLLEYRDR